MSITNREGFDIMCDTCSLEYEEPTSIILHDAIVQLESEGWFISRETNPWHGTTIETVLCPLCVTVKLKA
jgi:hypothetical protein